MTIEMSEKSNQAVRCSYCSEPIPLSMPLLGLFVAESHKTAELQCQSQAFILRCETCSKESRYLKAEIETFEALSRQTERIPLGIHYSYRAKAKAAGAE